MATDMLQYLDPDGLDETVLNIAQIKTSLEGQINDLEDSIEADMQDLPYARPDGIYPDMTVGAVIGADETAQWAQRETTGSGAATVRSVQGNTVVWNQLNNNNMPTMTHNGVTATNNGDGSWTLNGTPTEQASVSLMSNKTFETGHKLLVKGCPSGGGNDTYFIYMFGSAVDFGNGGIYTVASTVTSSMRLIAKFGTSFDNVVMWPQLFDLTQMFGAGNEPTTVAEFEQMYPKSYYPYSAPTLKPVQIAGIQSTDAQGAELDSVEWTAQTLRAAGSVRDELTSDKLVTRVGVVDLGTLDWEWFSNLSVFLTNKLTDRLIGASTAGICATYGDTLVTSSSAQISAAPDKTIMFSSSNVNIFVKDSTYGTDVTSFKAAMSGVLMFYTITTPTTQPISPALPMTYRVEQGGTESIIVPDGEVSAAPVLTVAEPVNAGDEFARIWEAIQSLGYTRNAAQLSRPVSLTDIGSIDEVQKDATDVVEIDVTKEVQE